MLDLIFILQSGPTLSVQESPPDIKHCYFSIDKTQKETNSRKKIAFCLALNLLLA